MTRAALVVAVSSVVACGCAIDTELGLAVDITEASAEVAMDPAGDVVSVTMAVDYRTGEHAMETHSFRPQSIDLFAGDSSVVTLSPERPAVFVPDVPPGTSRSTMLRGVSDPGEATDPRRLCGTEARLLFLWIDDATSEIGMTEATTSTVVCD